MADGGAALRGLKETLAALGCVRRAARTGAVKGAQAAAQAIARDARALAPVRTGRLRESIDGRIESSGPDEVRAVVGSDVEYAAAVELGARGRPARPFLLPAAERNTERAREIVATHIEAEIEKT